MDAPKINSKANKFKYWLRRSLIVMAFLLIVPLGLTIIGWLNRDTIIEVIQDWYNLNHTGTLSIGKVNSSSFNKFPKIEFIIRDISQNGIDSISDKHSSLTIERARLVLSVQDLVLGNIAFETVEIENAKFESWIKPTRPIDYYINLKTNKQLGITSDLKLPEWLEEDGIQYSLKNVRYINRDTLLNKHFDVYVNAIEGYYSNLEEEIHGALSMNIKINELGFNTKKGGFFKNQTIKGSPVFTYSKEDRIMTIEEFGLGISDQLFTLLASFDFNSGIHYDFSLDNRNTDLEVVKTILADSLAAKISAYNFVKPFSSSTKLKGSFGYGSNPQIDAKFSSLNNIIEVADKYKITDASFGGFITTDIYSSDSLKAYKKSKKDLKIVFDSLSGTIDGMNVSLDKSFFQSSSEALNYIEAEVKLYGPNEALAKLINTDNFDFNGGAFILDVKVNGDVENPKKLLDYASGSFNLKDTRVILKKNGLQLPIDNIDLKLIEGDANLRELKIVLADGSSFSLTGDIKNASGILYNSSSSNTITNTQLTSQYLDVNSLIATAKSLVPPSKSRSQERKDLNEIFEAIYKRFRPSFEIKLDSISYKDYVLKDVRADFEFMDAESVALKQFHFDYMDASSNLNGIVVVPRVTGSESSPIFLDIDVVSEGQIGLLDKLFDITMFNIYKGDYKFEGNINGNVKQLPELLNNAQGNFKLNNTVLHYKPAGIDLELDSMDVYIEDGTAFLDNFEVELDSSSSINISGSVTEFPGFLMTDIPPSGSISAKISSSFIDGDEILRMVNTFGDKGRLKDSSKHKALSTVFKDIYGFKPQIILDIDSAKYRDLITKDIKAKALFENDSTLTLKHLELRYKDTKAKLSGQLMSKNQITNPLSNPFAISFTIDVTGNSKDLNDYLKTTNFQFNSGRFTFKGNYYGESKTLTFNNTETFGNLKLGPSLVEYKPADISIPIDSIHVQINDDIAILKTLDIDLPGKSSIDFSGSISNFSDFINNASGQSSHNSKINIVSPYLDTKDIKTFLNASDSKPKDTISKTIQTEKIRASLAGIDKSFNPILNVEIDSLVHNQLILKEVGTTLLFDEDGNFNIEETGLDFYNGNATISAKIILSEEAKLPIDLQIESTNMDVFEVVKGFDYFNDDDLRKSNRIDGTLSQMLNVTGTINRQGEIDISSLNGTLDLEIYELTLFNYRPIMEQIVLLKEDRFRNLRFQPIKMSLVIKDGELQIPRTEIQSTALHFFIEGRYKMDDFINIWVSLPWNNLKSNDGLVLPKKTTYDEAGAKFFLQFVQDQDNEKARKRDLKVKFRLSNRKLKKENDSD